MKCETARWCLLAIWLSGAADASRLWGAEEGSQSPQAAESTRPNTGLAETSESRGFTVKGYEVRGEMLVSMEGVGAMLAGHTGTNLSVADLVQAAADVQAEYGRQGRTNVTVAIAPDQITNGVVTLNIFRGYAGRILVAGKVYPALRGAGAAKGEAGGTAAANGAATDAATGTATRTNTAATTSTNTGPRFTVRAYEIRGDTLLTTTTLMSVLVKYTGTNVGLSDIVKAASDLQMEYRDRGFPTVSVTIPQQQITNGIVKLRVFEGKLSEISVVKNRYYTSNNVMRALPSLKEKMILNGPIFQAELDRANANQDRQISAQIEPGAEVNTTALRLEVRDRLPVHGKLELNNLSSPGTPDLRVESSAVYNNLWQYEHSIGVQYSFSPEQYKEGDWRLYDRPLVANYSAFYRLPLGNPEALSGVVDAQQGQFGYDEATRKFQLPSPSGRPELNVYASRSTIDTAMMTLFSATLFNTNGNKLTRQDVQRDLTTDQDVGFRLSFPLQATVNFHLGMSGGLDYKTYELQSYKTNIFTLTSVIVDTTSNPGHIITNPPSRSVDYSPVPTNGVTVRALDYLPLSFRWDGSERDEQGTTTFGLGYGGNLWFSGGTSNLQEITGSKRSTGHWVILNANVAREQNIITNWPLSLRGGGQAASEPLISNEQFGIGGVSTVRGYREGEVFGDMGWWVSAEQKTPPWVVGLAYARNPLTLRGAVFMDYGEVYLMDPQGREGRMPLWGTGLGGVMSVGFHWEARLLFSWPLISSPTTKAGTPRLNFAVTAQF